MAIASRQLSRLRQRTQALKAQEQTLKRESETLKRETETLKAQEQKLQRETEMLKNLLSTIESEKPTTLKKEHFSLNSLLSSNRIEDRTSKSSFINKNQRRSLAGFAVAPVNATMTNNIFATIEKPFELYPPTGREAPFLPNTVSNLIINADAEARYLSPGELDQIKRFMDGGQRRLRVAYVLTESRERIVKRAGGALFQKRPDLISPGGNAYGEEKTASCLRDMEYYLRLVTYGVVAGNVTPIEEIAIIGAREMYRALGTPLEAVAESVREMKAVATSILTGADAEEAGFYFDYVVGALS
jgi:allophycocyanin alpha subunit